MRDLEITPSLLPWCLNFLTDRPQRVRWGNNKYTDPRILNIGAPQGCGLSPLFFTLYTHDCVATHPTTIIGKFADDTVVVGLISNNNETAYREEVENLTSWCKENNLLLNVTKTKEMIMDFRRSKRTPHLPITINATPVEIVDSYKYLGVHISGDLTWSAHVSALIKRTQGTLFHLRRLRKHTKSPALLKAFYSATVESVLANSITSWYGNCSGQDRKRLTRVIKAAERTTRSTLPRLEDIYY